MSGGRAARARELHGHLAVLSHLLAGEHEPARACLEAAAPTPAAFLRFVERHYLVWYLVGLLDAAGLRGLFAADELERIEDANAARREKVNRLSEELERLWLAFGAREVDVVLLKGPFIDQRFYGGEGRRAFFDMDLLVRRDRLGEVEALLAELGYERKSTVLLSRRLTARFAHGFDFTRGELSLDLHWGPAAHASYRIDADRLARGGGLYRSRVGEIPTPSDEDTLFLHLLSLFEDLDRGAARVRSFVDLYAMLAELDARVDWAAFWERRRRERTARVCQTVLGLFFALFGTDDRFPRAAGSVAASTERIRRWPKEEMAALVEAREGAIHNKLWAMRVYECPVPVSLIWWAVSLPFRLAAYRAGPPPKPRTRTP